MLGRKTITLNPVASQSRRLYASVVPTWQWRMEESRGIIGLSLQWKFKEAGFWYHRMAAVTGKKNPQARCKGKKVKAVLLISQISLKLGYHLWLLSALVQDFSPASVSSSRNWLHRLIRRDVSCWICIQSGCLPRSSIISHHPLSTWYPSTSMAFLISK